MYGSLLAMTISCTRSDFLRPIGAVVPPLMPKSLALIIERTPET